MTHGFKKNLNPDVLRPHRHGYNGTSGPPAPVRALTDLKLHLANPSFPAPPSSSSDTVVIHPGAVLAMLDLLPSISSDSQPEVRKPGKTGERNAIPVKVGDGVRPRVQLYL